MGYTPYCGIPLDSHLAKCNVWRDVTLEAWCLGKMDLLEIFKNFWGQLERAPIAIIISLGSIGFGLFLKRSRFPNRLIPLVVLLICTGAYAFLGDVKKVEGVAYPRVLLGFYGSILGFVTWGAHRWGLRRLEKYLPEGFLPAGTFDDDTVTQFKRKENTDQDNENKSNNPT